MQNRYTVASELYTHSLARQWPVEQTTFLDHPEGGDEINPAFPNQIMKHARNEITCEDAWRREAASKVKYIRLLPVTFGTVRQIQPTLTPARYIVDSSVLCYNATQPKFVLFSEMGSALLDIRLTRLHNPKAIKAPRLHPRKCDSRAHPISSLSSYEKNRLRKERSN